MKKIKKVTSMLVAIMMLCTLGGCGEKKEDLNSDISKVTIWSGNSHSKEVVTAFWSEWNETTGKEKGIYVEYVVQGGDSISKNIELALQSGTAPDIITSGTLTKLVEAGQILAIDDIPGGADVIKEYDEKGLLTNLRHKYKGKTYALPGGPGPQGLLYNKDLFKAAGIVDEKGEAKPPKTWSELVEIAKKLTDKTKNQYGIIAPIKWTGWFASDISNPSQSLVGFESFNPIERKFNYSGMKVPMQSWVDMFENNSVYPGAESLDNDSARAIFAEGNIGMKFGFNFDVGVLNDQFPAKCDWGVAPYPVNEDGTGYKQRMDYGNTGFINSASTVSPEKLLEVLVTITSREYQKVMFEKGVSMPLDSTVIEEANLDNPKKGWIEFAKLVEVSAIPVLAPKREMGGLEEIQDIFVKYVLTGKMTVDEAIKLGEENANKGMETYYEINDDQDINERIESDWEPELQ